MASYKEILEEKNRQFRALKQEEKEQLTGVEKILHWKVLEDARAQIKANFADKRRDLTEDPVYKAALLQNFNSNLFHLDENDWMREESTQSQLPRPSIPTERSIPRPSIPAEWSIPGEVVYVIPKEDESEHNKMKIVCPKCGETDHEPGAKFCHVCGSKFNADESNQGKKEEQKKSSRNRRRKKGNKKREEKE